MADGCFPNRKKLSQPWLRHVDKILFADRCWSSEKSDVIKYETGSSIAPPRLPSWKSITSHTVAAGCPIWMKFGFQAEFDLPKTVMSTNTKPEVVWSRRGRHLEIVYYAITPSRVARFGQHLAAGCKIACRIVADYCGMVEVATGRTIPIWRTFIFPNRN